MHINCYISMKMVFCLLSIILSLSPQIASADTVSKYRNLPFKQLGMKDGLSGHSIYGIERDSNGLVWIATNYGLNSFDGYRVKTYPTADGSMPNTKTLAVDSQDNVWLLAYDNLYMIRHLQDNIFGEHPMLAEIQPDIATKGRCSGKIDGMKKTARHGIMVWDSETLASLENEGMKISLDEPISDVCDHKDSECLLVVTISGKVCLIGENGDKILLTTIAANSNTLHIYQDNKQRIWIYQPDAKYIHCLNINGEKTNESLVDSLLQFAPITHILENGSEMYFSTNNQGLAILNDDEHLSIVRNDEQNPFSLPNNHLSISYIDNYDKLWIGSSKMGLGWTSLHPLTLLRYNTRVREDISCFGETADGQLIMGYDGGGLQIGDRLFTAANSSLPLDLIVGINPCQDGFYIGTYGGGLLHMDKNGTSIKPLELESEALAQKLDKVKYCIEDDHRRLWVGTYNNGLYLLEKQQKGEFSLVKHFNMYNSDMRTDCVTSMDITPDRHAIVVATSTGLYLFNIEDMTLKVLDNETDFRCVLIDQYGQIWAGTYNGLILMDKDGNHIDFKSNDRTLKGVVVGLALDRNGTVFATSPYSLSMISRQAYGRYFVHTSSSENGLDNMIFTPNSLFCCADGRVIAGGNACYASLYPNLLNNFSSSPKMRFTSIVLDGKDIFEVSDYIPNKHSITLEVSDMDCWGNAQYEYRLDGGKWMSALDNHIMLGHLIPGRYLVDVRLANENEDTYESISFRVGRWWEHWIFSLIFILAIILATFFGIRQMIRKIRSVKPFHVSATNNETQAPDAKMLTRVAQIIEENIANEEFSVEELASRLGMSRSNLFRRLKSLTGQTPIELIQDMRLQKAKQRLAQSGATISQVSYEVGLTPRQLTALFKKKYGKTPTQLMMENKEIVI